MIIKTINEDIFKSNPKHIAFSINTEGYNVGGFAGDVVEKGWKELENFGKHRRGSVFSKKIGDITYHALVCHSLHNGWGNSQVETIKRCFNKIDANGEVINSIAIGTGLVGKMSGADYQQIICGMQESKQKIILHSSKTMDEIDAIYERYKRIKRQNERENCKIDRETIYKIIRNIITDADDYELINTIKENGFEYASINNIDKKRKEILNYLDEMNTAWNEHHVDMTDRQYMKIIKPE